MSRMLFVNIPIANAAASRKFFDHLGFSFDDQFCDENTLCMAVNEQSWVMMLEHDRFRGFIADDIADTSKSREVLLCVSADSRAGVDELVDAALAAGGVDWMPAQELGFMYGRSFRDLDGHVWEVSWMDPAHLQ
ncbi:Possible glyoxalase/bleomycin resistance protein/ dioxygenase [Mycobacteroides abscessus subsp. abscessus]|uniref:VOC family protein n=1 Tax=Mycobacteroides abscessus TaxID=36809 RepID=UPI00092A6E40|nr:glyoxalase [Mycobacteroides abscessus]SHT78473.1 Possible glyoxalase/bleomycin resistance protein/ dioxygenase [Mycobacteroides abscessus subsp. abscessus]SHZ33201.1 lactoylglutathione lyase [Mycobacteroides abscessus subsp. abscessus]SID02329.1 Possible glyoxalase/bleomycin resistance protein/ dioxygenase [Mycobacteroides abscessus subsp. abscessus]SIE99280.1 lactoylglutathione lyase [Mycobacteroides abscessus subsp. abscessus]SIH02062.1 Possible glyoxalase/bleomycin resistance protein/ di